MDEERELDMEMEEDDPKKDRVIQNKLLFLLLCLLVFCIPVLWFFGVGFPANADHVWVSQVRELEDGRIELTLDMSDSAFAYTMVTQSVEDNMLLIKPRVSLVGLHRSGRTTVTTKVPVDELAYIYIQGDDENDRQLVWNGTEG